MQTLVRTAIQRIYGSDLQYSSLAHTHTCMRWNGGRQRQERERGRETRRPSHINLQIGCHRDSRSQEINGCELYAEVRIWVSQNVSPQSTHSHTHSHCPVHCIGYTLHCTVQMICGVTQHKSSTTNVQRTICRRLFHVPWTCSPLIVDILLCIVHIIRGYAIDESAYFCHFPLTRKLRRECE